MLWVRWLATAGFLAGTFCCLFGFCASFEPVEGVFWFRVAYAVAGAVLLGAAAFQAHKIMLEM